jgi:opacity protein-like surface antigen
MKKHFLGLLIILCAFGIQATAQQPDDYHKWEVYAGYLQGRNVYTAREDDLTFGPGATQKLILCTPAADAVFGANFEKLLCDRNVFHGFNAAATYNVSRYVGFTGDFTWQRHKATYIDNFGAGGIQTSRNTETKYMAFGGVQVKDNSVQTRFKPFAHALAGVAHEKLSGINTNPVEGTTIFSDQTTSFALKIGGGLDVRLSRRLDLRVIEVDYVPIFAGNRPLSFTPHPFDIQIIGRRANNVTFGVGLVIH